jgi:hypothetical protein
MKGTTMKQYRNASIICWLCVVVLLAWGFYGCAGIDTGTPEFKSISDAHSRTYRLASQVRGADRESKADEVRAGERFFANCDTFSRTVADLLVTDYGADPADVWLVQVDIPVVGFVWEQQPNGKWKRILADRHQVVLYRGLVSDNRWWPIVTMEDLKFDYRPVRKMNMRDKEWVRF